MAAHKTAAKLAGMALLAAFILNATNSSNSATAVSASVKKEVQIALPISGTTSFSKLESIDAAMLNLMHRDHITAAQLAVGVNGKIVYSKAFGFADKEHTKPAKTSNLFRIASCSKPITAVATMKLVEQGKLKLDDHMMEILSDFKPADQAGFDKRYEQITVSDLLQHIAGFSRQKFDPQVRYLRSAAQAANKPQPASAELIVRYALTQPLDHDPRSKFEYSNFGYNVLGRIIEHASGKPYQDYVKQEILAPAGITDMVIGKTKPVEILPQEIFYDDAGLGGAGWSLYAEDPDERPPSYGFTYALEAMDAHGGWLATAEDLVKFIAATDGTSSKCQLLKPEFIEALIAPPAIPDSNKHNGYYAKGWNVDPESHEWNHAGALSWGVAALICRLPDGVQVAITFNHLPQDIDKFFPRVNHALVDPVRKVRAELVQSHNPEP